MKLEQALGLRQRTEDHRARVRHAATLELIAAGEYLAYTDAKYAARLALSGAHARCCDGNGQVEQNASGSPDGPSALTYVMPCTNRECTERRQREWDTA